MHQLAGSENSQTLSYRQRGFRIDEKSTGTDPQLPRGLRGSIELRYKNGSADGTKPTSAVFVFTSWFADFTVS